MLLVAAAIWGSAFVAQKAGATLQPFTYNGIRMLLGGVVLIPIALLFRWSMPGAGKVPSRIDKTAVTGGVCCGCILALASNLQQFGIYKQVDAGKAGFITALYLVFVPILSLLLGKKVRPILWGCAGLGLAGFYLLSSPGASALRLGELLVLLSAVAFACHILAVDYFSPRCDGIVLSCIQFLTTGLISLLLMLVFEQPVLADILDCWAPILYCGIFSSGIAYTLQVLGQRNADPTACTLIMSLESVFAMLFGILIAGERLTLAEGTGCVVIFTAVLISQLPFGHHVS